MTIQDVLGASWFGYTARVLFTFVFWSSGVMKLVRFRAGVAEMEMFGLKPAWAFNVATIGALMFVATASPA